MQKQQKEIIINEELQEKCFGKNFRGATKSKIGLPVGESEKLHHWLNNPSNTLILLGPPGVGKTYILAAIIGENYDKFPHMRVFNERRFIGKIREGINKYYSYDFVQEIKNIIDTSLFVMDDLGSCAKTEWRDDVILEVVDHIYSNCVPTMISTNLTKEEIASNYHDRTISRLFSKKNSFIDMTGMPDLRAQGL